MFEIEDSIFLTTRKMKLCETPKNDKNVCDFCGVEISRVARLASTERIFFTPKKIYSKRGGESLQVMRGTRQIHEGRGVVHTWIWATVSLSIFCYKNQINLSASFLVFFLLYLTFFPKFERHKERHN